MEEIMLDFEKDVQKRVCQVKGEIVCFIDYSWVNENWFEESKFCISKNDVKQIWDIISKGKM